MVLHHHGSCTHRPLPVGMQRKCVAGLDHIFLAALATLMMFYTLTHSKLALRILLPSVERTVISELLYIIGPVVSEKANENSHLTLPSSPPPTLPPSPPTLPSSPPPIFPFLSPCPSLTVISYSAILSGTLFPLNSSFSSAIGCTDRTCRSTQGQGSSIQEYTDKYPEIQSTL